MSGQATATVEVLTAEVRVLMVGSRQITLSVAKQLDTVNLYDLDPMGRVKLGDGTSRVIGRHRESGVLAVAICRPGAEFSCICRTPLSGCSVRDQIRGSSSSNEWWITYDARSIRLMDYTDCGVEHQQLPGWSRCPPRPSVEAQRWRNTLSGSRAFIANLEAMHTAAMEMPLIVLAGLR